MPIEVARAQAPQSRAQTLAVKRLTNWFNTLIRLQCAGESAPTTALRVKTLFDQTIELQGYFYCQALLLVIQNITEDFFDAVKAVA